MLKDKQKVQKRYFSDFYYVCRLIFYEFSFC